jgi:hypothetical protein
MVHIFFSCSLAMVDCVCMCVCSYTLSRERKVRHVSRNGRLLSGRSRPGSNVDPSLPPSPHPTLLLPPDLPSRMSEHAGGYLSIRS